LFRHLLTFVGALVLCFLLLPWYWLWGMTARAGKRLGHSSAILAVLQQYSSQKSQGTQSNVARWGIGYLMLAQEFIFQKAMSGWWMMYQRMQLHSVRLIGWGMLMVLRNQTLIHPMTITWPPICIQFSQEDITSAAVALKVIH